MPTSDQKSEAESLKWAIKYLRFGSQGEGPLVLSVKARDIDCNVANAHLQNLQSLLERVSGRPPQQGFGAFSKGAGERLSSLQGLMISEEGD